MRPAPICISHELGVKGAGEQALTPASAKIAYFKMFVVFLVGLFFDSFGNWILCLNEGIRVFLIKTGAGAGVRLGDST